MVFKEITTKKFKSIMERLYQKDVWCNIVNENGTVKSVHKFYEEFEFCELKDGKIQFGNEEPDSPYLPFSINEEDIAYIIRNTWTPEENGEQIVIYMKDGIQIFVEHNA